MKTSKYLICNDIMAKDGQPAEFILHNHHPRFLAKVEELDFEEIENRPEKPFADILKNLGLSQKKTLMLMPEYDMIVTRSGRNIAVLEIMTADKASTYDILHSHTLLVQKTALKKIEETLG